MSYKMYSHHDKFSDVHGENFSQNIIEMEPMYQDWLHSHIKGIYTWFLPSKTTPGSYNKRINATVNTSRNSELSSWKLKWLPLYFV